MFTPGAEISGLILPVSFDGPLRENFAILSSFVKAPTEKESGREAGLPIEPSPPALKAPVFPAEKTGTIPAAFHFLTISS